MVIQAIYLPLPDMYNHLKNSVCKWHSNGEIANYSIDNMWGKVKRSGKTGDFTLWVDLLSFIRKRAF
jgi:hypothetical protein